ncbi:glucan biosynthesis protein [Coraliomargarita parva]|uniref:glucan biosynthesis protein n=1 Tax=Coraliomargarita parva TaxID=3014050 RepID=UPI0022B321B9|nr:glucan biosynthesis protein [Coraliomargarita parva]
MRIFLLFVLAGSALAQQERSLIDFEAVSAIAAERIQMERPEASAKLPQALAELDYDDYRNIRFRPSEALWWNDPLPFRVEFFHLGHIYHDAIRIFETSDTHVQEIPFLETAFNYEKSAYKPGFLRNPQGYAGIRVKYPLNRKDVYDDLIVFLGASYFRALGKGQAYGLSLRGLSMDTLGKKEEFPRFTELWLKKPKPEEESLTLFALLEGKRVTGAYQFTVHPNGSTRIDVRARLFFRKGGADVVGIAPITSMFVFGENTNHDYQDWRPEVHDSDGLLIHADREWTWHTLENLPGRYSRKFPAAKLRGFGLMQRDRQFRNYKDLEANYEHRPSAWITPNRQFPMGSVVLYTFGTATEATDNVTAFWMPDLAEDETGPIDLDYTISMLLKPPPSEMARVVETRVGRRTLDPDATTVIIEFTRPESLLAEEISRLSLGFDWGEAEVLENPVIQYNVSEDRIRVFAHFKTPAGLQRQKPYEMSAQLLREGHQVSERWSYSWLP